MNVKILKTDVISSLEKRIKELKQIPAQETARKKLDEVRDKKIAALVLKSKNVASVSESNYGHNQRDGYTKVEAIVYIKTSLLPPQTPKVDYKGVDSYGVDGVVEELESTVRILKMSQDEVVSAHVLKSVSKYL